MRTVAIIQARLSSTRLPGKTLMDIAGKSMLARTVRRTLHAQRIDMVAVATTLEPDDDRVVEEARVLGVPCIRGSKDDVLDRYVQAARELEADNVVRITSDCPLIDPRVIDELVSAFQEAEPPVDYASNTLHRTYPRGLDVEVFTLSTLERAWNEARERYEREHVTPYIWEHPRGFKLYSLRAEGRLRRPDVRLTVDTMEDLQLIRSIYATLSRNDQFFSTQDVIDLLDAHPELVKLNSHIDQKPIMPVAIADHWLRDGAGN